MTHCIFKLFFVSKITISSLAHIVLVKSDVHVNLVLIQLYLHYFYG